MKILFATPFALDPGMGGPAHTVVTTGLKVSEEGVDAGFLTAAQRRFPTPGRAVPLHKIPRMDLVHNFGLWTPLSHAVSMAARVSRVPLVLAPIGMLEPWALAQSAKKKQFALRLYQRGDLSGARVLHATSAAEVESIRALGVERPVALIPHGMDVPAELGPCDQDGKVDVRTALFLSRLHPKKGLMELVEAWARVRPRGWRVVVAGPDERGYRTQVEDAVRRYGLQADFVFKGQVEPAEKETLLRNSDLLVLPTYSENFGLVVPEALCRGTPVLTTRGTPWSELIETQSGWWIETGVAALASALEKICPMTREQLRSMGVNGRKLIVERYSWAAVARKHVELYRWIMGAAAKPAFVYD